MFSEIPKIWMTGACTIKLLTLKNEILDQNFYDESARHDRNNNRSVCL